MTITMKTSGMMMTIDLNKGLTKNTVDVTTKIDGSLKASFELDMMEDLCTMIDNIEVIALDFDFIRRADKALIADTIISAAKLISFTDVK